MVLFKSDNTSHSQHSAMHTNMGSELKESKTTFTQ